MTELSNNFFAALISPREVIQACESSLRLNSLARRVHHPLDKPLIPVSAQVAEYDREVEQAFTATPRSR